MTSILPIFPVPIHCSYLDRKFTPGELDFFERMEKNSHENVGNKTTDDGYVLNKSPLTEKLKKELLDTAKDYFKRITCPSHSDVRPYITQSWLNYTKKGEHHHRHNHQNSYLSGVLYIKAHKDVDRIYFYKNDYETQRGLQIETDKYHPYNSNSWWVPVETGKILLFPSYLVHEVHTKEDKEERISLAFNVYVQGTMGTKSHKTELQL
tara:strand:+ start:43 stop:666 length:624 start_codon:yes stop_codon:yes gene_type:complete